MVLLRATFANKLSLVEDPRTYARKVYFKHAFRCPVKAWFEETDKNPFGWVLQFETANDSVLKEFRNDIFKSAVSYIERRSKRKATDISFENIIQLAEAKDIRSSETNKEVGVYHGYENTAG